MDLQMRYPAKWTYLGRNVNLLFVRNFSPLFQNTFRDVGDKLQKNLLKIGT